MGRQPCCDKVGLKKGPWTSDEDKKLINFMLTNGQCCWRALPKLAGLLRCGKSCRLRWTNYLRPDLKRGLLSEDEENLVIQLHSQLGNRWSKIASHLSGRTDNEIKNHWNTHIKKKLKKMGIDPLTHKPLPPHEPNSNSGPSSDQNNEDGEQFDQANETISVQSSNITDQLGQPEDEEKSPISQLINDFCIDEVPLIQPHEMFARSNSLPSSTTLSPSSSSSTSESVNISCSATNMIEKVEELLPTFDWHSDRTTNNINMDNNNNNNNNMVFWDDDFMSSLELFLNEDESDRDLLNVETNELNNYSRMVLDEECFMYEQLL